MQTAELTRLFLSTKVGLVRKKASSIVSRKRDYPLILCLVRVQKSKYPSIGEFHSGTQQLLELKTRALVATFLQLKAASTFVLNMHFFPCRGSLSPARFRSRARLFWNQVTTCCFLKPKSLASHVPEDGDKCCLNLKLFSRVSH